MPQFRKRSVSGRVLIDLVEANVEAGFGLLDVAAGESCRGNLAFSQSALQEAEQIVSDIEQRLAQLGSVESAPFEPLVEELRREIDAVKGRSVNQPLFSPDGHSGNRLASRIRGLL